MNLASNQAGYIWGFLPLYGAAKYLTTPKGPTVGRIFCATDDQRRGASVER
jgi:hypothetical protein